MSDTIRLFCLPHSGATAQGYLRWTKALPSWISVRPVETPGRGARAGEAPRTDLVALAQDLAAELRPHVGSRYALFGHSIGAVVAFELAHALIDRGAPPPLRLFASASAAPALRDDRGRAAPMSDERLLDELRRLGGTPEEALAAPELMALVLPALRADFLMSGGYVRRPRAPLPCPITALGGAQDDVAPDAIAAWEAETSAGFAMRLFEGGHFFIHGQEREALDFVAAGLSAMTAARAAA
ncbi:thioesterase II family protein [Hansschlegelia plantiphila]|uniref:Thioesterase n=1 Tax=Hansschlegelia plantiphila TaxID=374655 RepID=A0A9W6MX85_9HYPH|nr:alpha/beta fold hydrolase [Hansschlegelia plantiphila]GLK69612.1 thioesterase [Hansschlegelia plantiphila]